MEHKNPPLGFIPLVRTHHPPSVDPWSASCHLASGKRWIRTARLGCPAGSGYSVQCCDDQGTSLGARPDRAGSTRTPRL